jgi:transcriptional regulator with XRE-family HTH domain
MSNIDDELDTLIENYLNFLEGEGPAPQLDDLPASVRDEARARIRLVDSMWGAQVDDRSLSEDPVARRYGFERAGQNVSVDGRRVAALRKAAGLDLKALLARVTAAGGDITPMALLQLEQSESAAVSQPTVSALVAALDVSLDEVEARASVDLDAVREFLNSPEFDELIQAWTAEHAQDPEGVRPLVVERVLTSQFRASDFTTAHLVDIVRAVLRSLEP